MESVRGMGLKFMVADEQRGERKVSMGEARPLGTASAEGDEARAAFELAAGGVDIESARAAQVGGDAGGNQYLLEGFDGLGGRRAEGDLGTGIEGDEVDLGADSLKQRDHLVGVFGGVVDPGE